MASSDTPLMQQWREAKAKHPDALLFFRVGDFYEFFYEDAEEGSRLLGLTLTSRNNGSAAAVPLAGVPARALDDYLEKLVRLGRRVAICEQVEDPAQAKGIVRREVVETVTPGTVLSDRLLDAGRNNYLVALGPAGPHGHGLAALDLSTGEFRVQRVPRRELASELGRLQPSEVVLPAGLEDLDSAAAEGATRTVRPEWLFDVEHGRDVLKRALRLHSLEGLGFTPDDHPLIQAAGALVGYVQETRPGGAEHLRPPRILRPGLVMPLDEMTRRNLELVETLRPGVPGGTLLEVLDRTRTAMGARLLRRWLLSPLVVAAPIWKRQAGVGALFDDPERADLVADRMGKVHDLERMAGKLGTRRATPRELRSLARSLDTVPEVLELLAESGAEPLHELADGVDPMTSVAERIRGAVAEDAPAALGDGGVIAPGYDADLDEARALRDGAVDFIASLQVRERERTGIGSLKVGFNKVFGYYLEVTRANLDKVPDDYHRKQTLANAERYFTPELKEWEEKVTGAEARIADREMELFTALRQELTEAVQPLQDLADRVARIDVLCCLARVARAHGYVRPEVHTGSELQISAGRHPVVEQMTGRNDFIPNDVHLDEQHRIAILTGPNMAGKSTVLRQVGLIQWLAQVGSWVPADAARLPLTDRIFTRVGASDNLVRGQSTFMVEMTETAAILNGATERSLVLLDEIGRGTSTYDGVSIAWAVTEHLHDRTRARTIFATHYHELTQLADLLPSVVNWNVSVREVGDQVVFLRRLEPGGADRSYGIQVARLAGLPFTVLDRARDLLRELEGAHAGPGGGLGQAGRSGGGAWPPDTQLPLALASHPVLDTLDGIDPDTTTPLEALSLLVRLKAQARGEA